MRKYILMLSVLLLMTGCIEPPLYLPDDLAYRLHVTLVCDTTLKNFCAAYPEPTHYELRRYDNVGADGSKMTLREASTIFRTSFTRDVEPCTHRLLTWSDIDSPDGTQVLTINDADSIVASTTLSGTGVSLSLPSDDSIGAPSLRNQPEIFYVGSIDSLVLTEDTAYYDYFDRENGILHYYDTIIMRPAVYCYKVVIKILHNNGRITGTGGQAALTAMSSGCNLSSGTTLASPCAVYFDSQMLWNQSTDQGTADIITGSLSTFGLCLMPPYRQGQPAEFTGGLTNLRNYIYFQLEFRNGTGGTYGIDLTSQVRKQCRGGTLSVVIDADDIKIPDRPDHSSGSGFSPIVNDYDEIVREFTL